MIYVVAFDPIKIQTCLAPQNDWQNPSFVKDNYVNGKKLPEMVINSPTNSFVLFLSVQTLYHNSMNHFKVRLRWRILYCCETCLSAVVYQPNINKGER